MPKDFYTIPYTNDVEVLQRELNRILDDISRRLNFLQVDGENISFGSKKITDLAAAADGGDAPRFDQVVGYSELVDVLLGTANRVTVVDNGDGTVTLTTPQNTNTAANPIFNNMYLNGNLYIKPNQKIIFDSDA